MAQFDVAEGWTGRLDFQLRSSGASVDLTGCTVALRLLDESGVVVVASSNSAQVSLVTTTCGIVGFAPCSTQLNADLGPYTARFKVWDGTGKIVFFPSGKADEWFVHSV